MADATNVKLGVCSVSFDGTDLGHTKGGVVVTYEPSIHEKTVDKYGETVVDAIVTGERLTAKVPLAESTLSNLGIAIPAGTESGSKLNIGVDAGESLSGDAAELVLHPSANDADDLTEDVVFRSAVSIESVELNFMVDEEKVFEVTFLALIDESQSAGEYLGFIGDSTT